jgi:hypothetical protein
VYGIVFDNDEFPGSGGQLTRWLILMVSFLLYWPVSCSIAAQADGAAGLLGFVVGGFILAGLWQWFQGTQRVKRVIELDPAADRVRVLKNRSVELEKPYSRMLENLEVADHPDTPFEEMEIGREPAPPAGFNKRISKARRMHVLYGYFGYGGAERVILVERYEWPSYHSLRQVQQAIYWTRRRIEEDRQRGAGGRGAGEREQDDENPFD